MATVEATAGRPTSREPQETVAKLGTGNAKWAIGFTIAAVVLFVFYQYLLPNLSQGTQEIFRAWLPITSVNEAMIWVIAAVGLNIVVGYAGLLDLGFVAFWAIGSYCAGWMMSGFFFQQSFNLFGASPPGAPGFHFNFWILLPFAMAFCALWGVLIGAPTLRLRGDYLAIVTLGFGEIIQQFAVNGGDLNGFNLTNGTLGITPIDHMTVPPILPQMPSELGVFNHPFRFFFFALLAALCVFVSIRLREGRLGRAWLAIREDELAASMMGVPLMRTKLAAYAVGAAMGGLAGVAYAMHVSGVIADTFRFSISITLLAMVVLGGMGNVWGVMIGAFVMAWINNTGLSQIGITFNSTFGTDINFPSFNFLLFGLVLVLMMLFRRSGLFPEVRNKAVMEEAEFEDGGGSHLAEPEEATV